MDFLIIGKRFCNTFKEAAYNVNDSLTSLKSTIS